MVNSYYSRQHKVWVAKLTDGPAAGATSWRPRKKQAIRTVEDVDARMRRAEAKMAALFEGAA